MGLIRNQIYGDEKCLELFLKNSKHNYFNELNDENVKNFIKDEYYQSGIKPRGDYLNYVSLKLANKYSENPKKSEESMYICI